MAFFMLQNYNIVTELLKECYICVNNIDISKINYKIYIMKITEVIVRVISGKARGTKLNSIESLSTRPTLDRVKESLFNIIQNKIPESIVLDLFAGSGAIGIECISRGCMYAYFGEKSHEAAKMIYQNLEKTKFLNSAVVIEKDYLQVLKMLSKEKITFDIIYIDPPYRENLAVNATKEILTLNLLSKDGVIIIETDDEERELNKLKEIQVNVYDLRKYGRASLIFLNRKE